MTTPCLCRLGFAQTLRTLDRAPGFLRLLAVLNGSDLVLWSLLVPVTLLCLMTF